MLKTGDLSFDRSTLSVIPTKKSHAIFSSNIPYRIPKNQTNKLRTNKFFLYKAL